jgi:methylenetetrahydrofolate reductase (NADPH)
VREQVDSLTFASKLIKQNRNRHLIYISGRDKNLKDMNDSISRSNSYGFKNIVLVSGERQEGESVKEAREISFIETLHSLHIIKKRDDLNLFPGCVANPFKYVQTNLLSHSFKVIKKLNQGANFIVTQAGWDMMKLQELRWYLESREKHYPTIARLMLLTPEIVSKITKNALPGITISPDFVATLEREKNYSHRQFEAAQWRRLQLQIAGCKLLGYTGIQIAGLSTLFQIETANQRIKEALQEFRSFDEWLIAYNNHLARSEMAPYPYSFYIFKELLKQPYYNNNPADKDFSEMIDAPIEPVMMKENIHYTICEKLFKKANREFPDEKLLLKKMLTGCPRCSSCRLPVLYYTCPEKCPKGLSNGTCGGTQVNGDCEYGNMECIHSKTLRFASQFNELSILEDRYIKIAERV